MKWRWVFLAWSVVGWGFLLTDRLPHSLQFSSGFFLIFYAFSVLELEHTRIGSWKHLLIPSIGVSILGFLLEVVGSKFGWPFGRYHYTSTLGFEVLGVPYPMAFAWLGVILNANLISTQTSHLRRAVEMGVWVLGLDLVLDPVALTRHFWIWQDSSVYYGIPIENFIGWLGATSVLSLLLPLQPVSVHERKWAIRLFQWMLILFGLLAIEAKEGVAVGVALFGILALERRHSHDLRTLKSLV